MFIFQMFFWPVNCKSRAFTSQYILDMDNILFGSLYYWHSWKLQGLTLLILAIFPNLEMTWFWSVNYICQVCKLKLFFWICWKFWTISMLIGSYLQLLLNIFYLRSTVIIFGAVLFDTFWILWKLLLLKKIFSKSSYIHFFCLNTSNFHNSGMIGLRKMPDPSVNRVFQVALRDEPSHLNDMILPWRALLH